MLQQLLPLDGHTLLPRGSGFVKATEVVSRGPCEPPSTHAWRKNTCSKLTPKEVEV